MTKTINIRTNNTKRVRTGRSVARTVQSIVTSMAEVKDYLKIQGTTTALTAGSVNSVSQAIVLGDEINQRTGRQIRLLSMDVRLSASLPITSPAATIRFLLISDHMSLGAVPAVTDVLEFASIVSPINVTADQAHRFKVLYDKSYPMVFTGANQEVFARALIPFREKVEYLVATDVVGANYKNAIYMLVISNIGGIIAPVYTYTVNMKFLDA